MSKYAKLTAVLITAWFVFSITASGLRWYKTGPSQPPLAFGLAAVTPIVLFVAWFALSPQFRQFLLSLDPRMMTFVQSWRFAGIAFVVAAAYGILPRFFAWPAGWGDMLIGLTAPFAAASLASANHRRRFILWQLLGIADLVNAMALGTLAGFIDPHGIPTSPMTVLPLSFIPTFGVPLFLILHVVSIAQARQWRVAKTAPTQARLRSQPA